MASSRVRSDLVHFVLFFISSAITTTYTAFKESRGAVSKAIFYLKNNLTLLSMVHVYGQGGGGRLVFLDKGKPINVFQLKIGKTQLKKWLSRSTSLPSLFSVISLFLRPGEGTTMDECRDRKSVV